VRMRRLPFFKWLRLRNHFQKASFFFNTNAGAGLARFFFLVYGGYRPPKKKGSPDYRLLFFFARARLPRGFFLGASLASHSLGHHLFFARSA
jgi:hypothetical protein